MPIIAGPKQKRGGQKKIEIPEAQSLINDGLLIIEAEIMRIKQKTIQKALSFDDQRSLSELLKTLIIISKEQRAIRKEDDLEKMTDAQLKELARHATKQLNKPSTGRKPQELPNATNLIEDTKKEIDNLINQTAEEAIDDGNPNPTPDQNS